MCPIVYPAAAPTNARTRFGPSHHGRVARAAGGPPGLPALSTAGGDVVSIAMSRGLLRNHAGRGGTRRRSAGQRILAWVVVPAVRLRQVDVRIRRQEGNQLLIRRRRRRRPRLKVGWAHYLAGRGHRAVIQATQLVASDVDRADLVGRAERDVVHSGVGVGLDAEVHRPERVDDVKGGDAVLNLLAGRYDHDVALEAAVLRVAERPSPLLPDHLDDQQLALSRVGVVAGGGPDRRRARTRSGAIVMR